MKELLFTGWNYMRWIRLILGILIAIQAIVQKDVLSGLLATFLLFQAGTNTGCCGDASCTVAPIKKKNNTTL